MATVEADASPGCGTSGTFTPVEASDGEVGPDSNPALQTLAARNKETERETLNRRQGDFTAGPSFKSRNDSNQSAGCQGLKDVRSP
jgi:hypothetical protein